MISSFSTSYINTNIQFPKELAPKRSRVSRRRSLPYAVALFFFLFLFSSVPPMAHTPPKKTRRKRNRVACFSGCFGPCRSDEVTQFEARPDDGEKLKISWFYWPRSRFKKSAAKTVPVEASAALVNSTVEAEKKEANDRFNNRPSKSKSKLKWKLDMIRSKSRPAKEAKAKAIATVAGTAPPGQPPEGERGREVRGRRVLGTGNTISHKSTEGNSRERKKEKKESKQEVSIFDSGLVTKIPGRVKWFFVDAEFDGDRA